jgi:hypothetical protein
MIEYDITCAELVRLSGPSLDGLLQPELRETYEQHLAFCGECRVFLLRQRTARSILGELYRPAPPAQLLAEIDMPTAL